MSFTINNKLCFIDSFQYLSSLLDSWVKNSNNDDFKYLSQELDNNVIDLDKKGFYLYEYKSDFEIFEEELPSHEKICSSLTDRKINGKSIWTCSFFFFFFFFLNFFSFCINNKFTNQQK